MSILNKDGSLAKRMRNVCVVDLYIPDSNKYYGKALLVDKRYFHCPYVWRLWSKFKKQEKGLYEQRILEVL